MKFDLSESIEILSRTPGLLDGWLRDLPAGWQMNNEGDNTWSPYDIVGHFIHGEITDWIPRMLIILGNGDKHFEPFDRFAQEANSVGKTMNDLLDEFASLRSKNMDVLTQSALSDEDFGKQGIHPEFGEVTLENLLATWTVHDMAHLAQMARVMAKQYKEAVGPWVNYMPILTR